MELVLMEIICNYLQHTIVSGKYCYNWTKLMNNSIYVIQYPYFRKDMSKGNSTKSNLAIFFTSILFFILFIPSPAQALCVGPKACGILGGGFLSMATIPVCILAFFFGIWAKTRPILQFFAVLPGFMTILTGYLMVLSPGRIDLIFVPLIHLGLMILMIVIGRYDSLKKMINT